MPDAVGLELVAQRVRERLGDQSVLGTEYFREQATLEVLPALARPVLEMLKADAEEPFEFLASLHACDYLPDEPRLGVHWQLLSMARGDRIGIKARVTIDEPRVPSVVDLWPGASFQEREAFDMFGIEFTGHPDLRRILMPEDYVGYPQRRDFPMGGEPVIFTFNQDKMPRWYE